MTTETTRDPELLPVVLSIYEEGREARSKGQSINRCPYINPRNMRSWVMGWKHKAEGKHITDTFGELYRRKS